MLFKNLSILILLTAGIVLIQMDKSFAQCTLKAHAGTAVTICKGASTTLGGPSIITGADSSTGSFVWQPLNDSVHKHPTVSPTVTTVYTLTVKDSGCTARDSVVVTVSKLKVVAGKNIILCQNDSTILMAAVSGGAFPYTYQWSSPSQIPNPLRQQYSDTTYIVGNTTTIGTFTVFIKVIDANGCTATDSLRDSVKQIPLVTITSVPNPAEYCNTGTSSAKAVLTAHNANSYIWSPNSNITSTTGATVTVNPTIYSSTYIVYGFSTNGCSASANVGVTVDPLPSPYVTAKKLTICRGDSLVLIPTGATNYSWSPSTSLTTTTGFKAIVKPTVTTTYQLTGIDNNNCSATSPIKISVIQYPVLTVSGDTAIFCPQSNVSLHARGAATYAWTPSTGLSSTIDSNVIASPASTTTYICKGKAPNCPLYTSDTLIIRIKPTSASAGKSTSSICPNQTFDTLRAANLTSITWTPSSGLSATTGSTVLASPTTTTTYTVTGTDTGNCILHFTLPVTSNPIPNVKSNSATVCFGNSTTITASGGAYYSWSPGTGLASTTSASTTAQPTITTTYTITGINTFGCTDTALSVVTVHPLPVINAVAASYTICANQNTTLSTASEAGTTYTWSPSTGLSATTGSSITANPPTTVIYTLTATSSHGCVSTDTVKLNVNPVPVPTISPKNGAFCRGLNRIVTLGGGITYTWSPAPQGHNASYSKDTLSPTATTTYTITAFSNKGCAQVFYDTITIYQLPVVHAGTDTSICNYTNVQLNKASPTGGTWTGTGVSGSGLFQPGTLSTGSYHLTYTYKDVHNCTSFDTLTAFVTDSVKLNAGSAFAVCKNAGKQALIATPTGGTWSGTGVTGDTFNPANAPVGLNTLTYTYVNGVCTTRAKLQINVKAAPQITYTPNLPCSKSTTYTLGSYSPTGGTWTGTGVTDSTFGKISPSGMGAGKFYLIYHYTNILNQCHIDTSLLVDVKKTPTASFIADSLVCINSKVTILNKSANASGFTWTWDTSTSSSVTPTVSFATTGFKTLTLIATDSSYCYDTMSTQIHVITVPKPTLTASTLLGCGSFKDIFINTTKDDYLKSILWNSGSGVTGTKDTLKVTYPNGSKDSVYVVILKVNSFCGTVYAYDTVKARIKPTASFSISYPGQCAPMHATFRNTGYGADSVHLYSAGWTTNTLPYYRTFNSGNYKDTIFRIYLKVKNVCGQDTTSKLLDVYQKTILDIWKLSDTIACTSLTVNFNDSSLGQTYFEWGTGDGVTSNTNPFSYTYSKPGVYNSYLYQHNNCTFDTVFTLVHVLPTPVANFTPANDTTCKNQPVIFTNTSTGLTSYKWYWGDGDSAITTNGTHSYNAVKRYTVELKGAGNYAGCVADTLIPLTIYPKAIENITANDSTGCAPLTISFTNTSTYAKTYYWDFADGGTSTTKSPNHTFTAIGSYKVMCVSANPYGCNDTAYVNIYVKPKPKAVFSISSTYSCKRPDTVYTTNSSTNAYDYKWTFGNGKNSTSVNPTIYYTYASTFTIQLIAIDNNCSDTATQTFSSYLLPSISIKPGRPAICIGDTTILKASGGSTYTWSPSSTLSSSIGSSVISSTKATLRYAVTGTDSHNCSDTASIRIVVNPLPVITTKPVNDTTICYGKNVSITASGGVKYAWMPATGLNSSTSNKVTASPTVSTTYTITGTDANGCADTATFKLKVNMLPNVAISPATYTAICLHTTQTLNAGGAKTYSWSPGGLTTATITVSPTTTTVFTLTGTDLNGCVNTDTQKVVVYALPVVKAAAVKSAICLDSSTTLKATGAATYTWSPAASLSATNGTPVTATPTVSTTYTLIGVDAHSCVDTTNILITVYPLPLVYITPTGFTGICPGKYITLKDSGTAKTFNWMPGSYSTTTITVSPTVTTTYTLTGTDFNGCISHDTQKVVVYVSPVVAAYTSAKNVCYNSSVFLSSTGAVNYVWSPSGSLSASTGSSVTATPKVSTTYSLTGIDAHSCTDTTSIYITVYPLPVLSISPAGDTICVGQTKSLTVSGASTYTWSPAAGLSSTTASLISISPAVTTTYTVTGIDANSCVNKDSIFVLVHPLPTVGVGALQNFVCLGYKITLGATGASTYVWSPAAGLSATTGSFVSASPASATRYVVTGTDIYNCSDTASINIAVYPAKIYLNKYTSTICKGDTVDLAAFNAVSFSWQPAGSLNTTSGNYVVAKPNTTTTYTVIGTDAHGCFDTAHTVVNTMQTPIYATDSAGACINTNATASASGSGIISYLWLPVTNIVGSNTGSSITVDDKVTKTYMVIGTDANNCKDTAYTKIIAWPRPSINFSFSPATGCAPLNVKFTNNTHNYQYMIWQSGDGQIYNDTNPVINYKAPGTFKPTAIAVSVHGCADTFNSPNSITIGIRPHAEYTWIQEKQSGSIIVYNVAFTNRSTNYQSLEWHFGDSTSDAFANPVHPYKEARMYKVLLVAFNALCSDSTYQDVSLELFTSLFVPNALAPDNGARLEDKIFKPKGKNLESYHLQIFDKWGKLFWESDKINPADGSPLEGWDGTTADGNPVPQDVYVWKIDATFKDGTKWKGMVQSNGQIKSVGTITLIR